MRFKPIIRFVSVISLAALLIYAAVYRPLLFEQPQGVFSDHSEPSRLKEHVRKLSIELAPRSYLHIENLNKAADYIQDIFRQYGTDVSEQSFEAEKQTYRNIFSRYGPDSGDLLVVGAHYDGFEDLPAADDNASGVAGLLELARLLHKHPPKVPVLLAAYTLEEPPFFRTNKMGSFVHARSLAKNKVPLKLMISLEMIAYFSDKKDSQQYPLPVLSLLYPSTADFIAIVGPMSFSMASVEIKKSFKSSVDLPTYSLNGPSIIPGVDFSDHMNFWNHGFDAVMITDTAFMRNTAYHTPQDTADHLDYQRMSQVVDGVFYYLNSLN